MKRSCLVVLLMAMSLIPVVSAEAIPTTLTLNLYAGKDMSTPAGTVIITLTSDSLIFNFQPAGDWEITEVHLYVATTPPTKHSPGRFPYMDEDSPFTISVPLEEIGCGTNLYIAAHAVVERSTGGCRQEETAWGWGPSGCMVNIDFTRGWGWYIRTPWFCPT